ncbi:MAG: hypothetical protein ABI640_10805 [Gammaproteobacteria bacterium]
MSDHAHETTKGTAGNSTAGAAMHDKPMRRTPEEIAASRSHVRSTQGFRPEQKGADELARIADCLESLRLDLRVLVDVLSGERGRA